MKHMSGQQQSGFSILEVMISLFVLAVGMLGVTQLQTSSLQNATKSITRSQAAYLGYEILDRIRANPAETYTIAAGAISASENCFTGSCTSAELKAFDLAEWKCSFAKYKANDACALFFASNLSTANSSTAYIDGDGSVACQPVGTEKHCQVSIEWREASLGANSPDTHNFSLVVVL